MRIICDYTKLKPEYHALFQALAVLLERDGERLEVEPSNPRRNMGGPIKEWLAARQEEEEQERRLKEPTI